MKKQIHELRTRIDGLAGLVKSIDVYSPMIVDVNKKVLDWHILVPSVYMKDCYKSLLLAKAWLGKVLAELGEESPYKNDGTRKSVEDIEPTADKYSVKFKTSKCGEIDVSTPEYSGFILKTYIEQIDWLRQEIKNILEEISSMEVYSAIGFSKWMDAGQFDIDLNVIGRNVSSHLTEARFHLGFELARLKEQEG